MLTFLSLLLFCAALVYVYRANSLGFMLAISFLLFGFTLRMISASYVGIFGPVYAEHFQRFIRDDGLAGIVFTMSLLIFIGIAAYLLRPASIARKVQIIELPRRDWIAFGAVCFFGAYIAAMYVDMLWRGVIPLFSFMERNVYTDLYAGIFHKAFFQFMFLFSFLMGFFFVRPRVSGGGYDLRYIGLLAALFIYFLLTGHRFSAFFATIAFFVIPVAAVMILGRGGRLLVSRDLEQARRVKSILRAAIPFVALLLFVMISYSLYNSLFNVRNYADPVEAFVQRTLVQPTELWWVTWESSIIGGNLDPGRAWIMMFVDPIDGSRNTGIQYLMTQELGYERAAELLRYGEQYAGGYPEVLFELLGPFLAWPAMALFAFATAFFLRIAILAVCNQHVGTAIFAAFLFYGFSLLYIGGMLNFLMAWTLYVKLALLAFFMVVEGRGGGRRIFARA